MPDKKKNNNSTDLDDAIIACSEYYAQEDRELRYNMLAYWRKLESYFQGFQRIYWDYAARDWRRVHDEEYERDDPTLYDKIINVYGAHGKSIIAALGIKLPDVHFLPEDADVTEDINTAKAHGKISEIIKRHNDAPLLFLKTLFLLYNQGVVAAYIYNRASKEYGAFKVPKYADEKVNVKTQSLSCPTCGSSLGENTFKGGEADIDVPYDEDMNEQFCEECGIDVIPDVEMTEEDLPQVTGYDSYPKTRTKIDVFGPSYAHMAFYARKQEQLPYIRLRFEQHEALLKSIYKDRRDDIQANVGASSQYDRWARSYQTNYGDDVAKNLVTTTCQWLRPWAYEVVDEDKRDLLYKNFPNGCYAVLIDEDSVVLESRDEDLDDHWVVTHDPINNYIHADPIGKPIAPVQELRNQANDLGIETFEHSIPETFADSEVLDFEKYSNSDAEPGSVYPVKAPMGKSVGDSFHSLKTATLTDEIDSFINRLDNDGQFVLGDFPSIYGGPAQSGSKTAREYLESRAVALQRLGLTWTMLKFWWAKVMSTSVTLFVKELKQDEKFSVPASVGSTDYINVWIRKHELTGSVGRVEPDPEEELPESYQQIRGVLLELIGLKNEFIDAGLYHPSNAPIIAKAIGLRDFTIPGKDNRDKQLGEISELTKSGPINEEMSSVETDPIDDDLIHMQTIKAWAVSATGIAVKQINPEGYQNVMMHMQQHESVYMQKTEQSNTNPEGVEPDSATGTTDS